LWLKKIRHKLHPVFVVILENRLFMKLAIKNIFYSFPVQLFILHFRKYQVLLVFWYIIGSTINSGFMKNYGADALFFVPEYLGNVNAFGAAIVGIALGIFFMSWNITTFIMHTKRCKFLATASQPFLEYCINNAVLPLLFLIFYFFRLFRFDLDKELMSIGEILVVMGGILGGLIFLLAFSFIYFFGAERRIRRSLTPLVGAAKHLRSGVPPLTEDQQDNYGMRVSYYISTKFHFRKVRSVRHYSQVFLDLVFKRHHFSGIISILLAFIFLIVVGFYMDARVFQVPAAASIFIFFALMIAVIGSLTYFLQSWSLPFIIVLVFFLDILYHREIIDPRNKAYGLNYTNADLRPAYTKASLQQLCLHDNIAADKANMLTILENWKKKQQEAKPVMIFINVSGGGIRSGTFVMNTLQQIDSLTNGDLMRHTVMMSGASGGMLAATYYRELYLQKQQGRASDIYNRAYTDNIAQDLLNPVFSSMIARDIFSPAQKFSVGKYEYVKDRGYAFEQKLSQNSKGLLNKQFAAYVDDEKSAIIPLMIFNSTISRDGRRMMICSQPISFMMKPLFYENDSTASPDAVDFAALFAKQDPMNVRLLTALRMNAIFPYVLPNVWLPTNPIIDVMDAGLRDNYGQETTLRFVENFKDWINKNTGGVIILQIRDRLKDNWQQPLETGAISDILLKPGTMLQHNWYKLQDYSEADQYSYLHNAFDSGLHRIIFMYVPREEDKGAALNFHLTAIEKQDVIGSFNGEYNRQMLKQLKQLLK
jgi:hypothetical protein